MSSSHHTHSSCDHGDHGNHGVASGKQGDVIRRLIAASWLCFAFLIIEVIGGYLAGSLAILSDAAHLFADLASFGVAIIAARLAALPTTAQHTFGLKRSESLAALLSMLSLAVVSIGLAMEAITRLYKNEGGVDGKMMSILAAIGVLVNVALALVLGVENHVHMPGAHDHDHGHEDDGHHHHDHEHRDDGHCHEESDDHKEAHDHTHSDSHCRHNDKHDESHEGGHDHSHIHHSATESTGLVSQKHGKYQTLDSDEVTPSSRETRNVNLQAAYLHVMGDLAQSFGVLIAGLLIWYNPNWHIVDPICTLIFCAFVFYSTLGIIRSSISILLEEVPSNVKWAEMFTAIQAVEGVANVHDLHIWSISQGMPSMSVHCSVQGDSDIALGRIYNVVKEKGVKHATIQIQIGTECITCYEPCNNELTMSRLIREEIV